jgi:hypothetical protein
MKNLSKVIANALAKEITEIPEKVESAVRDVVHEALGVEKRGSRYRVDRFDFDRSLIARCIQHEVQTRLEEYVRPIAEEEFKHLVKSKTLRAVVTERIKSTLNYRYSDALEGAVKEHVQEFGKFVGKCIGDRIQEAMQDVNKLGDYECGCEVTGILGG